MSYNKNCFFNFEDYGKDNKNSIYNRTKSLNINKLNKFNHFSQEIQTIKNNKNNEIHQQVISSIKDFEYLYFKTYRGDLYDITNLLLNCFSKIIVELDYTTFDSYYLKFEKLWQNYQDSGQIKDKYIVHHYIILLLGKIYRKHKHLINEYLISKIEELHYSYLVDSRYVNIKNYFNQHKLEYTEVIDIETVNNSTKSSSIDINNSNIDNNDDDSWEQVTNKKGNNISNKDNKKLNKYNTKSIDTSENNNQNSGNIVTIIEMDTNYISKINQEIINEYGASIEDIEPNVEFLEYVDSEPDSNYDTSSDDDNEYD